MHQLFSKIVILLIAALLCALPAVAAKKETTAGKAGNKSVKATLGWTLSNAEILEVQPVQQIRQGQIVGAYRIRAEAIALSPETPVQKGVFELNASIFSPAQEMPGQKPGFWYLQGSWTIVDPQGDPQLLQIKHNPYNLEGNIRSELSYNPAELPDEIMVAAMEITHSLAGGRWTEGKGIYEGSGDFNGKFEISGEIRPDLFRKKP